ncbi:ubiquitin carboxyl-terminal hydrolase 18-like [Ananas comosus]|uniref:Ubiquitin carboxyl-terminal hydrolase 18-like n=1 Tax=Ananas comosus TaxID=4615 RepID=A0A6P5G6J3_ANACO|nr:ubiquitin carboxyl-terminal hydrolase 18-like [Ananas comosus]
MPGSAALPALDLPALLQLALLALLLLSVAVVVVRRAASRYFVVDASFEDPPAAADLEASRRVMSIGGGGGDGDCATCGSPGSTKKCSRCKRVRYCSQECQSKHWKADHQFKCKQLRLSDSTDVALPGDGGNRRKSSEFRHISLVPANGTYRLFKKPSKVLFPYDEFLKLFNWEKPGFPPCGLLNCGNSCFANVVLQCLASTRPLVAYLLEKDHCRECVRKQEDWCFLCEFQIHIRRASESLQPFSPINILSRLPNIGGNLGYGRQEDAHEFVRFAIDKMQSACLDEFGGEKALDPSIQETTLIQHIFGGHLQSQVTCTECNMISKRYENMMDLTVEIHGDVESLEECLDQFTAKEWLDGENKYKCDGCNDYVKAWKRLTVHQAPNILTITLKRFQSGRFGKLNKRVTFPEILDLTRYISGGGDGSDVYALYAVVVHLDMLNASFFGHYICFTKDYHGNWYRIDDCKVMPVEVDEVLAQGAYMLLYSRRTARKEPLIKPSDSLKKQQSSDLLVTSLMPGSAMNCVTQKSSIEHSMLRDTEHGVKLPIEGSESMGPDASADVRPRLPVVIDSQNAEDARNPSSSSASEGHREENHVLPSITSKLFACPASESPSLKAQCLEPSRSADNECPMEIDVPSASSLGSELSGDSRPEVENSVASCSLSDWCNEGKNAFSVPFGNSGEASSSRSKELFPRGFLDKTPSRKKSLHSRREAQVGNALSSPRANGLSNGCPDLGFVEQKLNDSLSRASSSRCESNGESKDLSSSRNGKGILEEELAFSARGVLAKSYRSNSHCDGSTESATFPHLEGRNSTETNCGYYQTAFADTNGGPLGKGEQAEHVGLRRRLVSSEAVDQNGN